MLKINNNYKMNTARKGHSAYRRNKDKQSQDSSKIALNKNSSTSGFGSEVHNGNSASDSYPDNDENDEILYGYKFQMTDDQKKAEGELHDLKLDLGFTAEDESGPFYDVSERLRQLNEELAQEQIPEVEERNRTIQFKENLVDFSAPPPPDDDDDMEDERETSRRNDEPHDNRTHSVSGESAVERKSDLKKNGLADKEKKERKSDLKKNEKKDVQKSPSKSDELNRSSKASSEKRKMADDVPGDAPSKKEVSPQHEMDGQESVVVERSGRFEVVAVKDLTLEEREIYVTGPSSVQQPVKTSKSAPNSARSSTVKKSERKTSVASSVSPSDSSGSSRRASSSSRGATVVSARGDSQKVPTSARLNSPSNLQKKQHSSSMSNMEKYEQKRKEDEEKREKKEEADRHFQAWLRKKKEEEKKEKEKEKENKDEKKKDESKEDEEAFEKWKTKKLQQMQSEKKLKKEEAKYYESQWESHTETECEKNYKKWLKEKQKQKKEKEEAEREKMKTYRMMARKARNSANAASVGGSSAYIDYYGYRY